MHIFGTSKKKKRSHAMLASAIASLLAFIIFAIFTRFTTTDGMNASLMYSFHFDRAALGAASVGLFAWIIWILPSERQMHLVWAGLLFLFIAFFYSFDLDYAYILQKLPYLTGVGMVTTLLVSIAAISIAFIFALLGSVAKLSGNGIAMGIGSFYTSFFRGVPLLMQLFLLYMGLPQINIIIDPTIAGILALSLCYGAYMTEIFRSGILSIPKGQWEAADALGLSRFNTFRRVILPQAMRIIIPPTGNQFIAMLKDSSLISVVGVWDMMFVARAQGRSDFKVLEMLITASLIYWVLSIVLELMQRQIERRFNFAAPVNKKSMAKSESMTISNTIAGQPQ